MNRLAELLAGREPVLVDGGMGTLLQERGLDDGGAGELWNVERPDQVRAIHEEYAVAGAAVLTTNTFGANAPRLDMHGLAERVHEINRAAAEIAGDVARRHHVLVAGGIGPTGELLQPMGTMTPEDARGYFADQLRGLLAGGIDLVLVETMSDPDEAEAAIAAARTTAPDLPVVATLSFDTNLHTMMGTSPAEAVRLLGAAGADAVGANCGRGPGEMESIVTAMAAARPDGVLLVAQSNAGLPKLVGDRFVYDVPPAELADHAVRLRHLGVDVIGACCGSTPGHVAAMHTALRAA